MDDGYESLRRRIAFLEDVLEDIAILADGHRRSTLYSNGENVALQSVLTLACAAVGRSDELKRHGTVIAAPGTVINDPA